MAKTQVKLLKSKDRSRKTEVKTNGDVAQCRSTHGYSTMRNKSHCITIFYIYCHNVEEIASQFHLFYIYL